jgi:argonaute-like protein implicated in RNA metabolism and viral defense
MDIKIKWHKEYQILDKLDKSSEEEQKIAIQEAVENLKETDVLLVVRQGKYNAKDLEQKNIYNTFKKCAFENKLPAQNFFLYNFKNKQNHVVLGLLTKTGVIPYILAEPITCADIFVGLDVCHQQKKRSQGSQSFPAAVAFFDNQGKLLRYQTPSSRSSEGEIIPKETLHDFFPKEVVANKKVMVLRDGDFKKDEKENLEAWGKACNATFYCIEVIKSGSPKIYEKENIITNPGLGTAFILNDREAFLVTSTCNEGMPQPLLIRNHSTIPLQEVYTKYIQAMSPKLVICYLS